MNGLIFPGQGSQKLNMMRDFYDEYPESRRVMDEACDVLKIDLKSIIFGEDEHELTKTYNAQPALLTTSIMALEAIKSKGMDFDVVAGHSLGEYSALVASGVLSFDDALRAVRLRGELMENAIPSGAGSMLAVLGLSPEKVESVVNEIEGVYIANYNSPLQIVISGEITSLLRSIDIFKSAGAKRAVQLNVSGPFHSPLMAPAKEKLSDFLNSINFSRPQVPVILNVTGKVAGSIEEIRSKLIEQLTSPVRWIDTVNTMDEMCISRYIEVGSGNVLGGLVKKIVNKEVYSTDTTDEIEKLEGVLKNAKIAEF
jgi:[acyl-carrier-protein] S-malonyltransferase|uniref:Malonyl CoA-acyl carrier protein transacylase n=1 Tax=Mesoaciditoga lauensis TaxID=1495039 RepID=A0A7V3REU8_9BACT